MPPNESHNKTSNASSARRKVSLVLFVILFVTFAYFFHAAPGWNVNSRICLTYAIVEKRSFAIDDYQNIEGLKTEDIAFFNGHYYSDKVIGTSLLAAVPMTPLHLLSVALGHDFAWDTKRYIVTTFSVSLLGALAGVVLYRLLLLFGASMAAALFLVLAFIFGTQMFSVSTVFLSYAPAICFEMVSYYLLVRHRDELGLRILLVAGLALGAGLLCEYTLGIVAIGLSIYALYHLKRRISITYYWLGAGVPLLLFVGYTMICFGHPAIPYEYLLRSEFKEGMSQGFQGITGFNPTVLYYITIHRYRGLFYHSPFLLLAIWGWIAMWRDARRRSDAVLSSSMIVAYLAFNASYYMWWGGWTNGPRHLIPALPFLIVPLIWMWQSGRIRRVTLVVLFFLAFFFNALPAMVDAQIPQGYQARELYHPRITYNYRDPLWEIGIQSFFKGHLAMNGGQIIGLPGLWSLIPLALFWLVAGLGLKAQLPRVRSSPESPTARGRCV
jgi:hypothetical protein